MTHSERINDLLESVLPIIEKAAPSIAAAIGGPIGASIVALSFLVHSFMPEEDTVQYLGSLKDALNRISNEKESLPVLQKLEEDHGGWLTDLLKTYQKAEIDIKVEK